MPRFQKKSIVEALQFTNKNVKETVSWIINKGQVIPLTHTAADGKYFIVIPSKRDSFEGPSKDDNISLKEGDYIIKDVDNKLYRCEPQLFKERYEPVNNRTEETINKLKEQETIDESTIKDAISELELYQALIERLPETADGEIAVPGDKVYHPDCLFPDKPQEVMTSEEDPSEWFVVVPVEKQPDGFIGRCTEVPISECYMHFRNFKNRDKVCITRNMGPLPPFPVYDD